MKFLKTHLFFFIANCLFAVPILHAQKSRAQKIDSLENELREIADDSLKIRVMCKLAQNYVGIDSTQSFDMAKRALQLSKKIKDPSGMANAYFSLAYGYGDYGNLEKAKEYYALAKLNYDRILARNPSEIDIRLWVMSTYNLGVIYGREGFVNEEVRSMMEVTPMVEKLNDKGLMAILNSNMGIRFSNLEQYDKAYGYFSKAMKQFKYGNRINDHIHNKLAFSLCLYQMDSIIAMKRILDEAKEQLDEMPQAREWHFYYSYKGLYQTSQGNYNGALASYDKSKKVIEQNKMTSSLGSLYAYYMITYDSLKDYGKAKSYALKYLKTLKNDVLGEKFMNAHKLLADYEYKDKNFQQAYTYLKKYNVLKDNMKIDSVNSEMQELELRYRTEKKEKEILKLRNENSESALALEKRLSLSYLMALIIGILAILLVSGYIIYRNKQQLAKNKEKEHEKEMKLLKHEQQSKIFAAMIDSQEKERKRIAIDLHDGLGGRISAIGLKLSNNTPKNLPKSLEQPLIELKKDLDGSLEELRGIARNLMPETLSKYGLEAALKDYCNGIQDQGTKIVLQYYTDNDRLNNSTALTIYRIMQELINNSLKHARASTILAQYIKEGEKIHITIEDNGIGLTSDALNKKDSLGFSTLKTRVEYMNGTMDIDSTPNEGTTINIMINYDHERDR